MNLKYRQVRSHSGISFDILKSCIQKYIRRAKTNYSLQIANDFHHFTTINRENLDTNTLRVLKSTITNFINRLYIIAMEDISLGEPNALEVVDHYMELYKNTWDYKHLARCISFLCECKKARLPSYVRAWITGDPKLKKKLFHRQMRNYYSDFEDTPEDLITKSAEIAHKYSKKKSREQSAFKVFIKLLNYFEIDSVTPAEELIKKTDTVKLPEWDPMSEKPKIKKYCIDKHTRRGRLTRDQSDTHYFINVSSKITNRSIYDLPELKLHYRLIRTMNPKKNLWDYLNMWPIVLLMLK